MNTTMDAVIEENAITVKLAWLTQYAENVHLENAFNLLKARTLMDFPTPPKVNVDFVPMMS